MGGLNPCINQAIFPHPHCSWHVQTWHSTWEWVFGWVGRLPGSGGKADLAWANGAL